MIRRLLFWLAFGPRRYAYARNCLSHVVDMRGMHYADLVVRKDGANYSTEADWARDLQMAIAPRKRR